MAAELRVGLGIDATLVKGSGGVFDVVADGVVVFSKHRVGRFPDPGEVRLLLERHMESRGVGVGKRPGSA